MDVQHFHRLSFPFGFYTLILLLTIFSETHNRILQFWEKVFPVLSLKLTTIFDAKCFQILIQVHSYFP